nr:uncharacterized protein LOC103229111 [Chlorocebus sabaeus]
MRGAAGFCRPEWLIGLPVSCEGAVSGRRRRRGEKGSLSARWPGRRGVSLPAPPGHPRARRRRREGSGGEAPWRPAGKWRLERPARGSPRGGSPSHGPLPKRRPDSAHSTQEGPPGSAVEARRGSRALRGPHVRDSTLEPWQATWAPFLGLQWETLFPIVSSYKSPPARSFFAAIFARIYITKLLQTCHTARDRTGFLPVFTSLSGDKGV